MTKADEIVVLDKVIKQLGPHSYLGPWLAENRDRIVSDITSDYPVDLMLPGAAYRHGTSMLAETKAECRQMVADAKAQGEREIEAARNIIRDARQHARAHLERIAGQL